MRGEGIEFFGDGNLAVWVQAIKVFLGGEELNRRQRRERREGKASASLGAPCL